MDALRLSALAVVTLTIVGVLVQIATFFGNVMGRGDVVKIALALQALITGIILALWIYYMPQ